MHTPVKAIPQTRSATIFRAGCLGRSARGGVAADGHSRGYSEEGAKYKGFRESCRNRKEKARERTRQAR